MEDVRASSPVTHSLVKALRSVPDFAALDDRTLLRIVGASTNLVWKAGSTIFEKGSTSDALYVVLSGLVRVFDLDDGREVDVARLGPGESFGELSLLLHTVHSKSAQAVEDSELLVVPRESFEEVLASSPELAAHFRRRLQERLAVRGQVSESA
ncbi:MAG TPA: cyclic nucleotide-binding domain-containing protein [Actinomycetota bacterium]|nr:cyclic nucleotide-binding domain-containing protein [Actinomycetota bacterium]